MNSLQQFSLREIKNIIFMKISDQNIFHLLLKKSEAKLQALLKYLSVL